MVTIHDEKPWWSSFDREWLSLIKKYMDIREFEDMFGVCPERHECLVFTVPPMGLQVMKP